MPSVSEAQRRAMQAAAHGKSTLGIPEKVGKEFARADARQAKVDEKKARIESRKNERMQRHQGK